MSCEEKAKIVDELISEIEALFNEIKTTFEFQGLIMRCFEQSNPSTAYLKHTYFTAMTMGEVLFDRLKNMQKNVNVLVDKIYCKN